MTKTMTFNLGKFRLEGTRESAPVKKKPRLDEAAKEVPRDKKPLKLLEQDLSVGVGQKNAEKTEAFKVRAASLEPPTMAPVTRPVPNVSCEKPAAIRPQSVERRQPQQVWSGGKRLTPLAPMKLTDPRAEKLSVETLRKRFGIQWQERPR